MSAINFGRSQAGYFTRSQAGYRDGNTVTPITTVQQGMTRAYSSPPNYTIFTDFAALTSNPQCGLSRNSGNPGRNIFRAIIQFQTPTGVGRSIYYARFTSILSGVAPFGKKYDIYFGNGVPALPYAPANFFIDVTTALAFTGTVDLGVPDTDNPTHTTYALGIRNPDLLTVAIVFQNDLVNIQDVFFNTPSASAGTVFNFNNGFDSILSAPRGL